MSSSAGHNDAVTSGAAVYPTDEAVMRAIQEGHVDLLGTLFARYQQKVYSRCLQLVGDRQEADDLLQESFLRVLRYRQSFKGRARFSSWLYRIATNVCLDHLKARGRESEAQKEVAEGAFDGDPSPGDVLRLEMMRDALQRLDPEKRRLLLSIRVRGLGYAEAAAEAGVSQGAIRVRVHRALQELKAIVEKLEGSNR